MRDYRESLVSTFICGRIKWENFLDNIIVILNQLLKIENDHFL